MIIHLLAMVIAQVAVGGMGHPSPAVLVTQRGHLDLRSPPFRQFLNPPGPRRPVRLPVEQTEQPGLGPQVVLGQGTLPRVTRRG